MARRARSLERAGPLEAEPLARLSDVLERLVVRQDDLARTVTGRATFKTPTFDGQADVELFIEHFLEVAEANGWHGQAVLLHLREALSGAARDYGRARTVDEVFEALRARYGLSPRQARSLLGSLRRESRTPLQAHATEVRRLVEVAYRDLPAQIREEMAVETFCGTVGNPYLQRHLLAVATPTVERAVQAGNEFLQVKTHLVQRDAIHAVEEEPMDYVDAVRTGPPPTGPLEALTKLVQQLAEQVTQLQKPTKVPARSRGCYGCGKEGHIRSQCPTNPWTTQRPSVPQSGNDHGAHQ